MADGEILGVPDRSSAWGIGHSDQDTTAAKADGSRRTGAAEDGDGEVAAEAERELQSGTDRVGMADGLGEVEAVVSDGVRSEVRRSR